ncbi:hypothetical protein TKK_0010144 [Trichogramma kaykai]|uniref:FP protein C-terminal domain-containing protein n=1 Tax=Trichogramma kaykai TaxID=54128 RepID=A0ABD2WZZ4_9HYME
MDIRKFESSSDSDKLIVIFKLLTSNNGTTQALLLELKCVKSEVAKQSKRIEELEADNAFLHREVRSLKSMQCNDASSTELKICGIPSASSKQPRKIVDAVLDHLNLSSMKGDVIKTRFLPKSDDQKNTRRKDRTYIATFKSTAVRDFVIQTKIKNGQLNYGKLFKDDCSDSIMNLYAVESPYIHRLKRQARELANKHKYSRIWIRNNTVIVSKDDNSPHISIVSENDLSKIV